ncbi:MAG TPA: DUF2779 domain-containing protein [Paludibacteraceae bacterium]|nr:DUF2779 domain-containing protein [Paludibacteraceae bacterium]
MESKMISKSSFIRGMQCHKSLWLHLNQPEERDETSESQQQIFDIGHNVGELAQQLFPGGIDASRGDHSLVHEAITYTAELINNGQTVIYEAAFSDGETLCYMDILVKEPDGWAAYEVKASTQVKDYQVNDVAFQYFVITRSGLPLKRVSLVHVNNQYVRHGDLDIRKLFAIEPMTERLLPMQNNIPVDLLSLQEMLKAGFMPEISMGSQCNNPFTCDFLEFCQQSFPVEEDRSEGRPATRNQDELDQFLDELEYPLYFMDFETIQFAVPQFDESRPYQQIPFQYSLHLQQSKGGPLTQFSFLGTPPTDPRPEFIQSLLSHLGSSGSIIVWNQTFENTRLKEIARDFPEYSSMIDPLFDRVVDLMVPFRKKYLYTPDMNGSYSLKAVLPALVPDLSYSNLEIQEGGSAGLTYESLYNDTDPESIATKRENLLKYCELDTLSMVRILERF